MNKKPYFPQKPTKLDYIYWHVGRAIMAWVDAEDAIDACLELFDVAIPDPLYVRPLSTSRRITVFKKRVKRMSLNASQLQRGREIIKKFKSLSHDRHWLSHGVLQTFTGATWRKDGGRLDLRRRNNSSGELEWTSYHLSEVEILADEILALTLDIWAWIEIDLGCSTPEEMEKFVRKVRSSLT